MASDLGNPAIIRKDKKPNFTAQKRRELSLIRDRGPEKTHVQMISQKPTPFGVSICSLNLFVRFAI